MGLAGPRNRTKISHDPRNTAWSNSTNRFGHRILTTLGWTPGSTLGDTTSLYHQSGHITAASQAGVKIVLKDDNLGIGCNKRAREDECVGLDGLQDLLGRLNGKDEETIGKEVESRERMRREVIVGERYGMRFVRGETYVSSDIETLMKRIEGEKKVKKEEDGDEDTTIPLDESSAVKVKKEKKEKKSKRDRSSTKSASATPALSEEIDSRSSSKKRKRTGDDDAEKATKDKNDDKKVPKMSKKSKNGETREGRKARREHEKREKEARKAEKRKKRKSSSSDSSDSSDEESTAPSGTVTPSAPAALVGRQAVRHRYIAAKRSAVMDAKALNEIFMIKA